MKKIYWNSKDPIKIVTHHWSNNYMKGFDEYLYLDNLIKSKFTKQTSIYIY